MFGWLGVASWLYKFSIGHRFSAPQKLTYLNVSFRSWRQDNLPDFLGLLLIMDAFPMA